LSGGKKVSNFEIETTTAAAATTTTTATTTATAITKQNFCHGGGVV
jgi:hypothetical protein